MLPPKPLTLCGHTLEKVHSYKYLGVTLSDTLGWSNHVHNISTKARRVLGLIYRQYSKHLCQDTLLQLYISLVRPHLEYASQVWNPHLQKDILMLESVQKFGLRICLKQWQMLYQDCLKQCSLPDLKTRRDFLNLCLFYKIINNFCEFPDFPLQTRAINYPHRSTATLILPKAKSKYFLYSFFSHTSKLWNSLPLSITSATSLQLLLLDYFVFFCITHLDT